MANADSFNDWEARSMQRWRVHYEKMDQLSGANN